jgi:hypothetical protein
MWPISGFDSVCLRWIDATSVKRLRMTDLFPKALALTPLIKSSPRKHEKCINTESAGATNRPAKPARRRYAALVAPHGSRHGSVPTVRVRAHRVRAFGCTVVRYGERRNVNTSAVRD